MADQDNAQIKYLSAQLDAHKSAVNEFLGANLQLKSNVNMLQVIVNESNQKIEELNKQIAEANAKIDSLSVPPALNDESVDLA